MIANGKLFLVRDGSFVEVSLRDGVLVEVVAAPEPEPPKVDRLIPVMEWPLHHSWPPIGGLRHLIFHAETNGAGAWIRKVGRRILIDEKAFLHWARTNPAARQSA